MLGVYDDIAVLYRIQCQDCPKQFLVASCSDMMERLKWHWMFRDKADELPKPDLAKFIEGLHYGDPPIHACPGAGEVMNCYDLEVVEAWERYAGGLFKDWERHTELEGPMEDAWHLQK